MVNKGKETNMARKKQSAEATVRNIRRKTRKQYNALEKIRIVWEGLRGENTVAELWPGRLQRMLS